MTRSSPTRSRLARAYLALAAALALATGCIDERVSLGHHAAPMPMPLPSGGMMAATSGSGGIGGVGGSGGAAVEPSDAAIVEPTSDAAIDPVPDASVPRTSPCEGSVYAATLQCAVDFGAPMSTQSVLTLEPAFGEPGALAAVSGELAFSAWNADFEARLAGELDCERGELHVDIVQGTVQPMQGPQMGFVGMLDGFLAARGDALDGMWLHTASMGGPVCIGRWSAVRQD